MDEESIDFPEAVQFASWLNCFYYQSSEGEYCLQYPSSEAKPTEGSIMDLYIWWLNH